MEKKYIAVYHVVMFGLILPAIYIGEYALLCHNTHHYDWTVEFWDVVLVAPVYLIAVWMGVAVLEDFLYFLLNWHFPNALDRFWRGEMTCHTRYTRICATKVVPHFYITTAIWIVGFLAANQWIGSILK